MGFLTNAFRGFKRIGTKIDRGVLRLGRKFSHEATRRLKQTQAIASVVEESPILPVSLLASGVKAGARVAELGIEVGKDLDLAQTGRAGGRAGIEKAKSRAPEIVAQSAKTVAGVEGAAMFI